MSSDAAAAVELNEDLVAGLPTYSHSTRTSNSVHYLNVGRPKAMQMIEKVKWVSLALPLLAPLPTFDHTDEATLLPSLGSYVLALHRTRRDG